MTYKDFLERMKPCPDCISCEHCAHDGDSKECFTCYGHENFKPSEYWYFCETCGRPLHSDVRPFYYDLIDKITSIEWISVKDILPTDSRTYLCKVLLVEDGGNFSEDYITANYDQKTGKWNCDGMAVMEWSDFER